MRTLRIRVVSAFIRVDAFCFGTTLRGVRVTGLFLGVAGGTTARTPESLVQFDGSKIRPLETIDGRGNVVVLYTVCLFTANVPGVNSREGVFNRRLGGDGLLRRADADEHRSILLLIRSVIT